MKHETKAQIDERLQRGELVPLVSFLRTHSEEGLAPFSLPGMEESSDDR